MCGNSSQTWTSTDTNGQQATVTWCGWQSTNYANGNNAPAGDVYVESVFEVQANQAASFNTIQFQNNSVVGGTGQIGIGPDINDVAGGNSQPKPIDTSGDVETGAMPPTYQGSPSYLVTLNQLPQPESSGQMSLFAYGPGANTVNTGGYAPLVGPMNANSSFFINWSASGTGG